MPRWVPEGPMFWIFVVLLGLCLGSFLNVVIHRLPLGLSLLRPRSRCPHCGTAIAARDNVPVLSWLLLRGRCRSCWAAIPLRYPLVEISGAVCVTLAVLGADGPGEAAARGAFLLAMVAITWIDLDHRIIPDEISLPGVLVGILAAPLIGLPRLDAALGALVGAGALLGVALGYKALRGAEGMGMGDVKLAGMMGAFLGWKGVALALVLGSMAGGLLGIALLAARRAHTRTALPYGTFLAPAAGLVLLAGPRIWAWYLDLVRP